MTIVGNTSKRQQEQDEEIIRGATEERRNWIIVWETRRGEDVAGGWEITEDHRIRQEWEAINNMSRKRANVLLGSLYQGRDRHALCVETMEGGSSRHTDRTYVAC